MVPPPLWGGLVGVHDNRGNPWISMDIQKITMDIRGYLRISMDIQGYPLMSMAIHPWICMVDCLGHFWFTFLNMFCRLTVGDFECSGVNQGSF